MSDQANILREIVSNRNKKVEPTPRSNSSRVITVTSGKGGVGKTNFTVNLAIQLSKRDLRVVIIDADFGLANIELLFGVLPKFNFGDVLSGNKKLNEIITSGPMGIKFISGGSGLSNLANITESQMSFILENFEYLDSISDVILIDTGAGISKSVVNFIKASQETIIITTPEPTSVTDAYTLIKVIKDDSTYTPTLKIVVNRVDDYGEGTQIYEKLSKTTESFLGIKLQSLGSIPFDNHLVKAVKKQEPVSICYPNSESVKSIENITKKLMNIDSTQNESQGLKSFVKRLVNMFNK